MRSKLLSLVVLAGCAVDDPDLDRSTQEIVGGQPTPAGWFTETVFVRTVASGCTGVLIGPRTVLTAAHCVDGGDAVQVLTGGSYAWVVRNSIHPDFAGDLEIDLAVLVIQRVASGTPVPIDHVDLARTDAQVILTGYGRTQPDEPSSWVKHWGANVVDEVWDHNFTLADGGGALTCDGDSGGPTLRSGRVIGIHRAGYCTHDTREVRVFPFRAWIEDRSVYPFADAAGLVAQQYVDFLGRGADAGGLAYWSDRVRRGELQPEHVVANFLRSPEFAGTSAPIVRLYLAAFGRLPDSGGFYYWLGRHRGGLSIAAMAEQFGATPEFQARYGGLPHDSFVKRVYLDTLGRNPSSSEVSYWVGRLVAGHLGRGGVVNAIVQSAEGVARFTIDVDVAMAYLGMLRRSPDPSGFTYWKTEMQAGRLSLDGLISFVFYGGEYARRFDGV